MWRSSPSGTPHSCLEKWESGTSTLATATVIAFRWLFTGPGKIVSTRGEVRADLRDRSKVKLRNALHSAEAPGLLSRADCPEPGGTAWSANSRVDKPGICESAGQVTSPLTDRSRGRSGRRRKRLLVPRFGRGYTAVQNVPPASGDVSTLGPRRVSYLRSRSTWLR